MADVVDRLKSAFADRCTIDHEIGRGGMATVYLAEDVKHHRGYDTTTARRPLDDEVAGPIGLLTTA